MNESTEDRDWKSAYYNLIHFRNVINTKLVHSHMHEKEAVKNPLLLEVPIRSAPPGLSYLPAAAYGNHRIVRVLLADSRVSPAARNNEAMCIALRYAGANSSYLTQECANNRRLLGSSKIAAGGTLTNRP